MSHALQRQKTLFDNVNIDWNLSHDEGSTDFSDDETIIEDRVCLNNKDNKINKLIIKFLKSVISIDIYFIRMVV